MRLRFAVLGGLILAIAVVTTVAATRMTKPVHCTLAAEPERTLNLRDASDHAHLSADLERVRQIAGQYREQVRQSRPQSQSIAARNGFAGRPDRAYAYCVAVLDEQIATTHHVDLDTFQSK